MEPIFKVWNLMEAYGTYFLCMDLMELIYNVMELINIIDSKKIVVS